MIFIKNENIIVRDLLEQIKNSDSPEFSVIYGKIKDYIEKNNLDLYSDIFIPFVVFNSSLNNVKEQNLLGSMILFLNYDIEQNNYFNNININIEDLLQRKKQIIREISDSVALNESISKNNTENNNILEKQKVLSYTNFELESTTFKIFLDINSISIIEIFNLIQLNNRIPFAVFNGFYKILKGYIPNEEWNISFENDIVVKICQLDIVPLIPKYDSYTDIIISLENDSIVLEVELDTRKKNISQEESIEYILSIFPHHIDVKINKIEEITAKGSFYFPNSTLNNYIFSDLIMNNSFFSSLLAIDEHEKASKSKNSIYIHFFTNVIGKITANITGKISEKGDPILRGKDTVNLFKYDSEFIRVKITSSDNQESIHMFQDLLGKMINIYYDKYQEIFDIYKKYIPDFDVKKKKRKEKKEISTLKLKDIASEIFISGYTKKCNSPPNIIQDYEVGEYESNNKKVMRYPISEEEGIIPRNYVCNYANAPYPGLRNNPLENKDVTEFLPCCFKRDHSTIKGNIYANYFYGEDLKSKEDKEQQNFIITNKFTPFNWYGHLPENINKMFQMFDERTNYSFIRKGVLTENNSFLECVLEGLYKTTKINELEEKERIKFVKKERKKLSNNPISATLCKQEMYDFTDKEIIDMIKNQDIYFDPKYFTSLLENVFNCNIYVFNRKNMTTNAQLQLPRFMETYYKNKNNLNSIFIYQHTGSQSDHSKEQRCELIIRWKETDSNATEYSFNNTSKVSKGIFDIFSKLNLTYSLNKKNTEIVFPINNDSIRITGQGIDSYGKTRMVRINFKDEYNITILTSPIPPLNCEEIKNWVITKISGKIAEELAKTLKIQFESQDIINNYAQTYNGILGNVDISIPIKKQKKSSTLEHKIGIKYPETNDYSVLENYNKYKKLSRYILSYLFWLYSRYIKEENKTISQESIETFVENNVEIIPDFEYGNITKIYDINNSSVLKDSKLVVKSEETLKRLLYSLKLFSRQKNNLINYYKNTSIENYYLDITDFDQQQFQVIIQGEKAVENWINEQTSKYILYNSIQTNSTKPYFFKNKLINNKMYLAQNTLDIKKAINIYKVWTEDGYNIGINPPETNIDFSNQSYKLFLYQNSTNIKKYSIGINKTEENVPNLVVYKVEEETLYTILLEL